MSNRRSRRKKQTRQAFPFYFILLGVGAVLIVAGIAATLIRSGQGSAQAEAEAIPRADAAPDFELASLDSGMVELADYRGQYVLVNFWATWCPPCRAELPDLVGYYHDHAAQGFQLLGINEQEPASVASGYVQAQGLDFPVLLDVDGRVMNRYAVSGLPSSFLINPQGEIVQMWTGMISRATLERVVTPLLEG